MNQREWLRNFSIEEHQLPFIIRPRWSDSNQIFLNAFRSCSFKWHVSLCFCTLSLWFFHTGKFQDNIALAEHPLKSLPLWIILGACSSKHYNDVIMSVVASQITSVSIVYLNVCSGADQRKRQSSASLAFVRGIHGWPVNSPHKGPVTRNMFHLMTSSWYAKFPRCGSCNFPTRQHSTQSVGNMPPPSPPHLLPQVLQIMPRNPKYDQFQPKGHHNEENPQSTTKMPGNPKF